MLKPIRWIIGLMVIVWVGGAMTHPHSTLHEISTKLHGTVSKVAGHLVTAIEHANHSSGSSSSVHTSAAAATHAAWMNTTPSGAPVTWHSCTIDYVLYVHEAPGTTAVTAQVRHALALLTAASGIHFVFQGYTNVIPSNEWATTGYKADPALAGDTYPPVNFGWASRGQSDLFAHGPANAIAMTGPDYVTGPGGEHYVSGAGVIDASYAKTLTPGFGAGVTEGEVLVHEWEHILGLGEGTNPADSSYTEMIPRTAVRLGASDTAALHTLGGHCAR